MTIVGASSKAFVRFLHMIGKFKGTLVRLQHLANDLELHLHHHFLSPPQFSSLDNHLFIFLKPTPLLANAFYCLYLLHIKLASCIFFSKQSPYHYKLKWKFFGMEVFALFEEQMHLEVMENTLFSSYVYFPSFNLTRNQQKTTKQKPYKKQKIKASNTHGRKEREVKKS